MRILLIEDDVDIADNMVELLELEGHDVDHKLNGNDGLEAALADNHDFILCDVQMPGLSGFEVLNEYRDKVGFSSSPFIFVTASAQPEDIEKLSNSQADGFVTKPFSTVQIVEVIDKHKAS